MTKDVVELQNQAHYHRQTWINAMAAAVGGLLFGYDTSVISGAILFVRAHFRWDSFATEVAVSIVLACALLGAAVGGVSRRQVRRKPLQIANAIIFGVFAVLTGLATTTPLFLISRLMVGFAVGVTSMITPLYIAADFSTCHSRSAGSTESVNDLRGRGGGVCGGLVSLGYGKLAHDVHQCGGAFGCVAHLIILPSRESAVAGFERPHRRGPFDTEPGLRTVGNRSGDEAICHRH